METSQTSSSRACHQSIFRWIVYYLMKKYPHKFQQRGLEEEKFIDHKAKCDPNCLGYVELYGNDFEWKKMRDGTDKLVLVE